MITGRQTLADITGALRDERARLEEVDRRLKSANERLVGIDAARTKEIAALARLHVGELATGAEERLEGSDARVAAMLQRRESERASLEARLRDLVAAAERLERERIPLVDALEVATMAVDDAEAATQARLERDDAYRAQRERAVATERTARHADEKALASQEERLEKGRAFEADPIFMYLWRRGYGTPAYRAWPLVRRLDRAVARLIPFESARVNYARLVELPERLREHADAVASAADAELESLHGRDMEARVADGVDALEAERDVAEAALARHDAVIADVDEERQETFDGIERMDRGEDDAFAEAVAFLASELARDDVQALRRAALATPYPEDDVIVGRLLDLEAERDRLATTVGDLEGVAQQVRERSLELDAVRREYTARRFDEPGSAYADGDLVTNMLSQFLRGAATRDVLWRVLEGQRSTASRRSNPTFGSGGFGRGSPWTGGGASRGSSAAGRMGSGGARGGRVGGGGGRSSGGLTGGGFKTGGRMGGRGFKTGGKR
ncbi:MAG: hypothetical protein H0U69_00745 [Trueperaceae bacterium]|nr:hypothetical protein [Trueperaceae bacterium]